MSVWGALYTYIYIQLKWEIEMRNEILYCYWDCTVPRISQSKPRLQFWTLRTYSRICHSVKRLGCILLKLGVVSWSVCPTCTRLASVAADGMVLPLMLCQLHNKSIWLIIFSANYIKTFHVYICSVQHIWSTWSQFVGVVAVLQVQHYIIIMLLHFFTSCKTTKDKVWKLFCQLFPRHQFHRFDYS